VAVLAQQITRVHRVALLLIESEGDPAATLRYETFRAAGARGSGSDKCSDGQFFQASAGHDCPERSRDGSSN
jgi:hypothetical protein